MLATEVCTAAVPFNQFFSTGCSSVRWWACVKLLLTSLSFLRDVRLTLEVLDCCCVARTQICPWPLKSALTTGRRGLWSAYGRSLGTSSWCCCHASFVRRYHVCTWGVRPSEIYLPSQARAMLLWLQLTKMGELIKITSTVIKADRGERELFLCCCCNGRQEAVDVFMFKIKKAGESDHFLIM